MDEKIKQLQDEKERLTTRLAQLNVRSTGSDRIEERLQAINDELAVLFRPPEKTVATDTDTLMGLDVQTYQTMVKGL